VLDLFTDDVEETTADTDHHQTALANEDDEDDYEQDYNYNYNYNNNDEHDDEHEEDEGEPVAADVPAPVPAVPSLANPLSALWPPAGLGLTGPGAEAAARGFLAAGLAAGGLDDP